MELFRTVSKDFPKSITTTFYITRTSRSSSPSESNMKEEVKPSTETLTGRPDLGQIVKETVGEGGTIGIASKIFHQLLWRTLFEMR